MNISPTEAEQALEAIQTMMNKTRKAISNSGAYNFLIVWGFVWLFGFLASHFFTDQIIGMIWLGLDIVGGLVSVVIGIRMSRKVRSPSGVASGASPQAMRRDSVRKGRMDLRIRHLWLVGRLVAAGHDRDFKSRWTTGAWAGKPDSPHQASGNPETPRVNPATSPSSARDARSGREPLRYPG